MNTTRKQIIELIEPFMDKTEQYNFLFRDGEGKIREMNQYMFIAGNEVYIERPGYDEPRLFCNIKEVIGHYDITAVLKYIENKGGGYIILNGLYFNFTFKNTETENEEVGIIPNKPLYLYSEQEEKDLLELLTKIGLTNK